MACSCAVRKLERFARHRQRGVFAYVSVAANVSPPVANLAHHSWKAWSWKAWEGVGAICATEQFRVRRQHFLGATMHQQVGLWPRLSHAAGDAKM